MKFGILAPGVIAQAMATAVNGIIRQAKERGESPVLETYAVGSRSLERAQTFAAQWGYEKAYGSYMEVLDDPALDLVYIASPHSHHYEHVKMCLQHGKHVLVEKAFTINERQAKEIIDLAEEKGLLLAEAIWTRYMPSRTMIDELIESGVIGKVTTLTANLGYEMSKKERLIKPELAGGALLDVGIYPINFALMVIHSKIKKMSSSAVMSPEGVDLYSSMLLEFESGELADLHTTMLAKTDRRGMIYGDKGYLECVNINDVEMIRVFDLDDHLLAEHKVPEQINGYEYEVLSCIKAITEGKTECPEMPHSETLRVMRIMDSLRASWGMKYPME